MPFWRPLAGSLPFVHGVAESYRKTRRNGPGSEPSMPDGKSGCAPKLNVRLVIAVPAANAVAALVADRGRVDRVDRIDVGAAEVDDVSRLRDGDVDREHRRVVHPQEPQQLAVGVGDGDHHRGPLLERETNARRGS